MVWTVVCSLSRLLNANAFVLLRSGLIAMGNINIGWVRWAGLGWVRWAGFGWVVVILNRFIVIIARSVKG